MSRQQPITISDEVSITIARIAELRAQIVALKVELREENAKLIMQQRKSPSWKPSKAIAQQLPAHTHNVRRAISQAIRDHCDVTKNLNGDRITPQDLLNWLHQCDAHLVGTQQQQLNAIGVVVKQLSLQRVRSARARFIVGIRPKQMKEQVA